MTDTPQPPLVLPSANFETQKFTPVNDATLRIRPSIGSQAFSLLFVIVGIGLLGVAIAITFSVIEGSNSLLMLLIGAVFIAAGGVMYRQGNTQIIINRDSGAAFVRSWWPTVPLDTQNLYQHIQAQEMVAIQTASRIIESARTRGKATRYTQFQVNLCTADGKRHNVFVTTRQECAEDLASHLRRILNITTSHGFIDHSMD